ncbi:MAG: hypothetical protein H7Y88_10210 [Phycisphaerales bacterium]|nr:hypothetical protein [Phycisphaerales bacterium]
MGLHDRHYGRAGGGFGGGRGRVGTAFGRMFSEGDNPLSWSFPIGRVFRIQVRVHLFFVIYIAAELIQSLLRDNVGIGYQALLLAGLFGIVFLHELGHCFACRWVGGEAHQILMWPLGGLATVSPPHHWKAALITTIGGPTVNVLLLPVFGGIVWLTGGDLNGYVFFNVLSPWSSVRFDASYWQVFFFALHFVNFYMLAFNVLLVMFPLDGGRILQELLWRKLGYERSMWISVNIGLVLACTLGVLAMVGNISHLIGIAIFAGFTCWQMRRNLQFMSAGAGGPMAEPAGISWAGTAVEARKAAKVREDRQEQARKDQERQARHQEEFDRVLDKIKRDGMGSLTNKERAILQEETDRKRGR